MKNLGLIKAKIIRAGNFEFMGNYLVETHLHAKEASLCSEVCAADMIDACKEKGYSAVFVTDHFFNGNTAIDRSLEWEQQIDEFFKGYENAKKRGDEIGVKVFFGLEFNNMGNEFLIYKSSKEWLKAHPEIMWLDIEQALTLFRNAGAFVIHAHPFREAWYVKEMRTFPDCVDAVEVFNGKNAPERTNEKALDYAERHKLLMTAGSDAHKTDEILCGCVFENPIESEDDFINQLKSGTYTLLQKYYYI